MKSRLSKIQKKRDQLLEVINVSEETKSEDTPPPIVVVMDDCRLATGRGKSYIKMVNDDSIPGLAAFLSSIETYQSFSDDESQARYPCLVINSALRWYESELEHGGIMLYDWICGQFQCFKSMQTYKHQKTFLRLHQKNCKRLFVGMFKLLPIMKEAGIAHNNINLETIMLYSLPDSSQKDNTNLFSFIDGPPWYPQLTSFGCASLAGSSERACLTQWQFHKLIKDHSPVVLDIKTSIIIFRYYRGVSNYQRYLAPDKMPLTPKGDMWTLGVLLWECLTNTYLWQHSKSWKSHDMMKKNGFKIWFSKYVKIPSNDHLPYFVPEEAIDLLDRIFKLEKERISVDEALNHVFFRGVEGVPARTSVDLNALSLEIQISIRK